MGPRATQIVRPGCVHNSQGSHIVGGWESALFLWAPNINPFRDPRWGRACAESLLLFVVACLLLFVAAACCCCCWRRRRRRRRWWWCLALVLFLPRVC